MGSQPTLREHIENEELWISDKSNPLENIFFVDLYRGLYQEVQPVYRVITSKKELKKIKGNLREQALVISYLKGYPIPIEGVVLLNGKADYLNHPKATQEQIRAVEDFKK